MRRRRVDGWIHILADRQTDKTDSRPTAPILTPVNSNYLESSGGIFYLWQPFPTHLSEILAKLKPSDFSAWVTVNQSHCCFIIMSFERLENDLSRGWRQWVTWVGRQVMIISYNFSQRVQLLQKKECVECPSKINTTFPAGFLGKK
jgi:hypothetical protein